MTPNLYEVLGVPRDADAEQINNAFREKALLLHPDKNKTDPDAARKFTELTQAYQVLTDPQRRKKYDETLPALPVESVRITDMQQLWKLAGDRFFEQSERFTPAVDAMRVGIPLVIENDALLIVGIPPVQTRLIGYINSAATQNKIRRILSDLYGQPLDFRVISGATLQDWQNLKAAEEKMLQRKSGGTPVPTRSAGVETPPSINLQGDADEIWEELLEGMMRQWSACTTRSLPQTRAQFVLGQLAPVSRTEDIARAKGIAEDGFQRNLARALDRIANLTGIESGTVALEYLRYRARLT